MFYRLFIGFIGFSWVLLDFAGFYLVLLGFTRFARFLIILLGVLRLY